MTTGASPSAEHDEAVALANNMLDRVNADPDDDLCVLARHFMRSMERVEQLTAERDALQGDLNVRDHKIKGLEEARDDLAKERDAWRTQYGEEYITVDRVWRALGITTYKDAGGKTVSELVADMRQERDALLLALREIEAMYDHANPGKYVHFQMWETARKALHSGDESVTPPRGAEG